jgi:hypothetical protein
MALWDGCLRLLRALNSERIFSAISRTCKSGLRESAGEASQQEVQWLHTLMSS